MLGPFKVIQWSKSCDGQLLGHWLLGCSFLFFGTATCLHISKTHQVPLSFWFSVCSHENLTLRASHGFHGVDKNPLCIQDAACEDLSDIQFSFPKPCSTMFMSPWHLNLWTTAQTMQESFNINPGLFAVTSWIIRSYNLIESVHISFNSSHGCHILSRNFMPRSSSPCFCLLWSRKKNMPSHAGASPFSTKQLFIPRFQLQQFVLKLRGFDPQVGDSY